MPFYHPRKNGMFAALPFAVVAGTIGQFLIPLPEAYSMRSLLLTGLILFALSFCGLSERLKNMTGGPAAENSNAIGSNTASTGSTSSTTIDAAKLTAEQQAIASSG